MSYIWGTPNNCDDDTQKILCPYCNQTVGADVHIIIKYTSDYVPSSYNPPAFYVLECPSCQKPVILNDKNKQTHPQGKALNGVMHLPEDLKSVYNEIRSAIAAGCYTSAVIMCRTAIMHIAVDVGAEQNKSFLYYVDYLCDNGYLPPNAKVWVDKVRVMANDAVHKLEIWGKEDAELIGKFLMYMLLFIYELPASVE